MSERRMITCDVEGCHMAHTEVEWGDGHLGWGQLHGISLNGVDNPHLCPVHLGQVANFVDSLGRST